MPTYPGGSVNVEAAAVEEPALNFVGPEKVSTTSNMPTLIIAPINCIEQEGTLEGR